MTKIKLEFEVEEINLILEALGQQPFVRVYALIGRLQEQARAQVAASGEAAQRESEANA